MEIQSLTVMITNILYCVICILTANDYCGTDCTTLLARLQYISYLLIPFNCSKNVVKLKNLSNIIYMKSELPVLKIIL
jgi:hypothetical protein